MSCRRYTDHIDARVDECAILHSSADTVKCSIHSQRATLGAAHTQRARLPGSSFQRLVVKATAFRSLPTARPHKLSDVLQRILTTWQPSKDPLVFSPSHLSFATQYTDTRSSTQPQKPTSSPLDATHCGPTCHCCYGHTLRSLRRLAQFTAPRQPLHTITTKRFSASWAPSGRSIGELLGSCDRPQRCVSVQIWVLGRWCGIMRS